MKSESNYKGPNLGERTLAGMDKLNTALWNIGGWVQHHERMIFDALQERREEAALREARFLVSYQERYIQLLKTAPAMDEYASRERADIAVRATARLEALRELLEESKERGYLSRADYYRLPRN